MSVRTRVAKKYRKEYLRQTGDYTICNTMLYHEFMKLNDYDYWKRKLSIFNNTIKQNLSQKNCKCICICRDHVKRHYEYIIFAIYKHKLIKGEGKSVQAAYDDIIHHIEHCDVEKNSSV